MGRLFIVHIGHYLIQPQSGVYQKYLAIYDSLKPIIDLHLIAFTHPGHCSPDPRVQVIPSPPNLKWKVIDEWMEKNLLSDDVVWLRYPFASPSLFQLTQKWGAQMVLEHNTNEITEALFLQRNAWKSNSISFKKILSRSWWIYTWNTWVANRTDETRWAKACLQNVKGGISVTFELEKKLHSIYSQYSTFVLPNCVPLSSLVDVKNPVVDEVNLKMIMLIGSYDYWQGIERIIKSIESYKGDSKVIQLDIYGTLPDSLVKKLQKVSSQSFQICLLPAIQSSDLGDTLNRYHLGIGTLSLHRKKMQEACPLKVRDYWRVGLPSLLGYTDTGILQNPALADWNLIIANDDSEIPWEKVVQFSERQKMFSNAIRRQVYQESITYESKVKELITFLFKK